MTSNYKSLDVIFHVTGYSHSSMVDVKSNVTAYLVIFRICFYI